MIKTPQDAFATVIELGWAGLYDPLTQIYTFIRGEKEHRNFKEDDTVEFIAWANRETMHVVKDDVKIIKP